MYRKKFLSILTTQYSLPLTEFQKLMNLATTTSVVAVDEGEARQRCSSALFTIVK